MIINPLVLPATATLILLPLAPAEFRYFLGFGPYFVEKTKCQFDLAELSNLYFQKPQTIPMNFRRKRAFPFSKVFHTQPASIYLSML